MIIQEYPYLIDQGSYVEYGILVLFNSSKQLNPSYSFYCNCNLKLIVLKINSLDGSSNFTAELVGFSQFKCNIRSNSIVDVTSVSLLINDTQTTGLSGKISAFDSNIKFTSKKNIFFTFI